MLHGADIFTYMTGWFLGQTLVTILYMDPMGYGFGAPYSPEKKH